MTSNNVVAQSGPSAKLRPLLVPEPLSRTPRTQQQDSPSDPATPETGSGRAAPSSPRSQAPQPLSPQMRASPPEPHRPKSPQRQSNLNLQQQQQQQQQRRQQQQEVSNRLTPAAAAAAGPRTDRAASNRPSKPTAQSGRAHGRASTPPHSPSLGSRTSTPGSPHSPTLSLRSRLRRYLNVGNTSMDGRASNAVTPAPADAPSLTRAQAFLTSSSTNISCYNNNGSNTPSCDGASPRRLHGSSNSGRPAHFASSPSPYAVQLYGNSSTTSTPGVPYKPARPPSPAPRARMGAGAWGPEPGLASTHHQRQQQQQQQLQQYQYEQIYMQQLALDDAASPRGDAATEGGSSCSSAGAPPPAGHGFNALNHQPAHALYRSVTGLAGAALTLTQPLPPTSMGAHINSPAASLRGLSLRRALSLTPSAATWSTVNSTVPTGGGTAAPYGNGGGTGAAYGNGSSAYLMGAGGAYSPYAALPANGVGGAGAGGAGERSPKRSMNGASFAAAWGSAATASRPPTAGSNASTGPPQPHASSSIPPSPSPTTSYPAGAVAVASTHGSVENGTVSHGSGFAVRPSHGSGYNGTLSHGSLPFGSPASSTPTYGSATPAPAAPLRRMMSVAPPSPSRGSNPPSPLSTINNLLSLVTVQPPAVQPYPSEQQQQRPPAAAAFQPYPPPSPSTHGPQHTNDQQQQQQYSLRPTPTALPGHAHPTPQHMLNRGMSAISLLPPASPSTMPFRASPGAPSTAPPTSPPTAATAPVPAAGPFSRPSSAAVHAVHPAPAVPAWLLHASMSVPGPLTAARGSAGPAPEPADVAVPSHAAAADSQGGGAWIATSAALAAAAAAAAAAADGTKAASHDLHSSSSVPAVMQAAQAAAGSGPAAGAAAAAAKAVGQGQGPVPAPPPTPPQPPPPPPPQQQQLRRAHSTLESSSLLGTQGAAAAPGVLMALGATCPHMLLRDTWRLEDFALLKQVYKGSYSAVHKAACRISSRIVIIKIYDTTRMTELARNHVKREVRLHSQLQHYNVLNLYAAFSQGPLVVLVEEVAEGGDLYMVLKHVPGHRLSEDRAVLGVVLPLLRALVYLHGLGIVHRDLKLENIVFADRQHTHLLLADFGISLSLREERAVTRAGTTEYMSPEQLRCPFKRRPEENKEREDLAYSAAVDVWALGVLSYELVHGRPPFLGAMREETERLIAEQEVAVAAQCSSAARDFIVSCLHKDAAERPTAQQLLSHAWIRTYAAAAAPLH